MSTPAKAFVSALYYFVKFSSILWAVTLVCDRVYAFHLIYKEENARLQDEEWLRTNCKNPEFYANMKSHTNICALVEHNAMRNLFLYSAKQVMHSTYLCGLHSCVDYLHELTTVFFHMSTPLLIIVVVIILFFPVLFSHTMRIFYNTLCPQQHHMGGYYQCAPSRYSMDFVENHELPEMRLLTSGQRHYPRFQSSDETKFL